MFRCLTLSLVALLALGVSVVAEEKKEADVAVVWQFDNLKEIGGQKLTVVGEPRVVDAPGGKALAFDGVDDAIFLDVHPLAGAKQFTVEVIFRPDAGGPPEQRFFHLQEDGSENRVLFETRLRDGKWFLDTFIQSGKIGATLFAEDFKHPLDQWYHAAIVVDGKEMRAYVDGKLEMTTPLAFEPHKEGRTSLGVRINKVFWFKGAARTARFTRRVLDPKDFLKAK